MAKTQKIIEAEANLQLAKLLNAIAELNDAMMDFYKMTGSYNSDFNQAVKDLELLESFFAFFAEKNEGRWTNNDKETLSVINRVKDVMIALKNYDMSKDCKPNLQMVQDVVDGIKLRSQYERELNEKEARLERAKKLYEELKTSNDSIRQSVARLLDDKSAKEEVLRVANQYQFNDVIDRMMANYQPKISCDTDSESPF